MSVNIRVHSTMDYDKFQFIEDSNRQVSQDFVALLVKDPTFPKGSPKSPIVVMERTPLSGHFKIIDGQHRFSACKKLKIPVYFIIDENGKEEDIAHRNSQMRQWKMVDFVKFYSSKGNKNYEIVRRLREKHKCSFSFIHSTICAICKFSQRDFSRIIKEGKLNIMGFEEKITEFCDTFFSMLKSCNQAKRDSLKPIILDPYIKALCHIYDESFDNYKKMLDKLAICNCKINYVGTTLEATNVLTSVCKWRRPRA
jgi:ParB-like nuclease domain